MAPSEFSKCIKNFKNFRKFKKFYRLSHSRNLWNSRCVEGKYSHLFSFHFNCRQLLTSLLTTHSIPLSWCKMRQSSIRSASLNRCNNDLARLLFNTTSVLFCRVSVPPNVANKEPVIKKTTWNKFSHVQMRTQWSWSKIHYSYLISTLETNPIWFDCNCSCVKYRFYSFSFDWMDTLNGKYMIDLKINVRRWNHRPKS